MVLIISILYYLRLIFKAIKVRDVYEVLGSIIRPIKPGVGVLACWQLHRGKHWSQSCRQGDRGKPGGGGGGGEYSPDI